MNFDLPAPGTGQSPAFINAVGCRDWLARAPLANAVQAQAILLRQLNLLHRFALPPAERLAILEALRGPVSDVQDEAAKQFAGKPLPLAPHEQAALESTVSVWHMLALGYLRCFAALCADDGGISPLPALSAQRTLSVFADWQVDLCRGEQLPDASYWKKLHQIFLAAETLGIATRAVNDPVRHGNAPTSALAAYAECNLLSTANPHELPPRHLAWVARWARRWGAKLALLKTPPEDIRNRAVPLWVDLESDRPASYGPQSSSSGRWLETTELRKSLVARIALLDQGRAPAELQLGDDVTQPAAPASCCSESCSAGARAAHRAAMSGMRRAAAAVSLPASKRCITSSRVARPSARPPATMQRCVASVSNSRLLATAALMQPIPPRKMIRVSRAGRSWMTGVCSTNQLPDCASRGR